MSDEKPKAPDPLRPTRAFGWRKAELSPTEIWAQRDLVPTPLYEHLVSLHTLVLHLGAEGDVLTLAERSLRQIAIYTHDPHNRK